jgi:hypothetical protein
VPCLGATVGICRARLLLLKESHALAPALRALVIFLVLAVGDAQLAAHFSVGLWSVPMLIGRLRHALRAL